MFLQRWRRPSSARWIVLDLFLVHWSGTIRSMMLFHRVSRVVEVMRTHHQTHTPDEWTTTVRIWTPALSYTQSPAVIALTLYGLGRGSLVLAGCRRSVTLITWNRSYSLDTIWLRWRLENVRSAEWHSNRWQTANGKTWNVYIDRHWNISGEKPQSHEPNWLDATFAPPSILADLPIVW